MTNFLQSQDWMKFQQEIGHKVFKIGDTRIIKRVLPLHKSYFYIPGGPMSPITNDEFRMMNELAMREQAIFIKAEPLYNDSAERLIQLGFRKSFKEIQPHQTIILDLEQSQELLLKNMHPKTRYNIKVAEREHVVVELCDDANVFMALMRKTTERDNFSAHPEWYYRRMASFFKNRDIEVKLWAAWHEGKPLATALVATYGTQAFYLHGASDHEHRALMGPHLLHWRIIHELQASGFKLYDLWGIDAQKWPGVTRFKLGWGGKIVEYPGAFDLTVSPFWQTVYNVARKLR